MPIYTRAEWGARHPSVRPGVWRRREVVIHTEAGAHVDTGTDNPATAVDEGWGLGDFFKRLRNIEAFHVNTRGWDAIAYSFLVDPVRGWAAEGRGWGENGTHTQQGRNSSAYAICFLGNGDNQAVTEDGWKGAELVIRDGLARGAIAPGYKVTGHRDYVTKSCPGNLIYPHIGRLRGLSLVITPPTPPEEDDMAKLVEVPNSIGSSDIYRVSGVRAVHISDPSEAIANGDEVVKWKGTRAGFIDAHDLAGQPLPR